MSIRVKIVIACLGCALVPLITYAVYTYARTIAHLDQLEEAQLAAREIAVGQALDDVLSEELADLGGTATWGAFVRAVERGDAGWLRRHLASLPDVSAGGTAQLITPDGELLVSAGSTGAKSLWLVPEVQRVAGLGGQAAGYETLDGRLSIAAARTIRSDSGEPRAVLAVVRPVDEQLLSTIGSYAGVRVQVAPADVAEEFRSAGAPDQATDGVMNQFGETFTDDDSRSAYLGVYDTDGYRSGLIQISMERSAVGQAVSEIRTMTAVALAGAFAVAVLAALLLSRRISKPLQELATAAVAIAGGDTRQEVRVSGGDEVGQLAGAFTAMSERITERVTDLSDKIRGLTDELMDLDMAFGETLTDVVDADAETARMLPRVGSLLKGRLVCLYQVGEDGGLRLVHGDAGAESARLEDAARQAVASGATLALPGVAAAPLTRAERETGALVVFADDRRFDAQDTALLSALAGHAAMATQNAATFQRLESSYFSTVTALAGAIETKEDYPPDHCRLIAAMAGIVGARLDRGEADLRLLRYAAVLHDVGKTGVPESILRSPGRLGHEQSMLVEEHTVIGESIVARIPYLRPVAPVIRSAHERWDGHGYPDRLRGEEIPWAARVVLACDAYCAMVSDRPYRKALTPEAAFAELAEKAGAQFDPRVVGAITDSRAAVERLFVTGDEAVGGQVDRVLATVLFTDIVDSTVKAAELGDGAWYELLDRHNATVRALLKRYRGGRIETAGDGLFATFDGAARAVQCAAAIGRELAPLGLSIRAGCHTGEIELMGADVGGIAVHIGARVAALAAPGEILVSGIVKDLVAGSGLAFADRGEHELKGVPGVWRLYAVVEPPQ